MVGGSLLDMEYTWHTHNTHSRFNYNSLAGCQKGNACAKLESFHEISFLSQTCTAGAGDMNHWALAHRPWFLWVPAGVLWPPKPRHCVCWCRQSALRGSQTAWRGSALPGRSAATSLWLGLVQLSHHTGHYIQGSTSTTRASTKHWDLFVAYTHKCENTMESPFIN